MPSGLYNTLINVSQNRAQQQAAATLETAHGVVQAIYTNANGVYAADVLLYGQKKTLVRVPNVTNAQLTKGGVVTVNNVKGNPLSYTITGFGSSGTSQNAAAAGAAIANSNQFTASQQPPALDGVPMLLWESDSSGTVYDGLVEVPGTNIYFHDTLPQNTSGDQLTDGIREVNMFRLVLTALPPVLSVRDGLLVDLVDPYTHAMNGMYRASYLLGEWVRENPIATTSSLGEVIVGSGLAITGAGVLSTTASGSQLNTFFGQPLIGLMGGNTLFTLPTPLFGTYAIRGDGAEWHLGTDYTQSNDLLPLITCVVAPTQSLVADMQYPFAAGAAVLQTFFDETLTGTVNGANKTFTLPITPVGPYAIFADGFAWKLGVDYTAVGNTITTTVAPNEWIVADIQAAPLVAGVYIPTYLDLALTGTINGINKIFTLPMTPSNSFAIKRDGSRDQTTFDYTVSGLTITFVEAPTQWATCNIN